MHGKELEGISNITLKMNDCDYGKKGKTFRQKKRVPSLDS